MEYTGTSSQRETYKLVEQFTTGDFSDELSLLKALVKEIIEHKEFAILGGRIWEFNAAERSYVLRHQYGELTKISEGYSIPVEHYPVFGELIEKRISLHTETDQYLKESGIGLYSVAAVGDIIRVDKERFYRYVIGFNAPEILQSFYETLNVISSVASVRLRDLNYKEEQRKYQRDINKASEIQRNLLPRHYMEFHDYKIFGVCIPDSEVGGDYFDYLKNKSDEEERLGIVISDAASKGLPAAIQALFVSGAIRMGQSFSPKISVLLSRLNNQIFDTFPYERFVTLFYCELTLSSNRLVLYANAGHCAPIHYSSATDTFTNLRTTGGLLGIAKNQKFNVENVAISHDDILVLYTDGISEAMDKNGNLFGEKRICDIVRANKDKTVQEISYMLIEEAQKFSAESNYNDDKTIVVIKRDSKILKDDSGE